MFSRLLLAATGRTKGRGPQCRSVDSSFKGGPACEPSGPRGLGRPRTTLSLRTWRLWRTRGQPISQAGDSGPESGLSEAPRRGLPQAWADTVGHGGVFCVLRARASCVARRPIPRMRLAVVALCAASLAAAAPARAEPTLGYACNALSDPASSCMLPVRGWLVVGSSARVVGCGCSSAWLLA